jgi:hypothetical protein
LSINQSTITANTAAAQCLTQQCATLGGGMFNDGGTIALSKSSVTANSATAGCGRAFCHSDGGGIFNNTGGLTITQTTISGNTANESGGIDNRGTLGMTNSTVSGNRAYFTRGNATGGGISNGGTLIINSSTISGNSAQGSIGSYGGGIAGTATLQNTIVANNTSGGNCYGTVASNGYNLSSDWTCNFAKAGDLNFVDPMLGPLQGNGGPTKTMALRPGSPAIDAGNPNGCTDGLSPLKIDQRGKPRPGLGDTGVCDIGAYERQN